MKLSWLMSFTVYFPPKAGLLWPKTQEAHLSLYLSNANAIIPWESYIIDAPSHNKLVCNASLPALVHPYSFSSYMYATSHFTYSAQVEFSPTGLKSSKMYMYNCICFNIAWTLHMNWSLEIYTYLQDIYTKYMHTHVYI